MNSDRDHEANARRARGRADEARERATSAARRATEAIREAERAQTVDARRLHAREAKAHRTGERVSQQAAALHDEHAAHEHDQALRDAARRG